MSMEDKEMTEPTKQTPTTEEMLFYLDKARETLYLGDHPKDAWYPAIRAVLEEYPKVKAEVERLRVSQAEINTAATKETARLQREKRQWEEKYFKNRAEAEAEVEQMKDEHAKRRAEYMDAVATMRKAKLKAEAELRLSETSKETAQRAFHDADKERVELRAKLEAARPLLGAVKKATVYDSEAPNGHECSEFSEADEHEIIGEALALKQSSLPDKVTP
jgi:hypothetical protein